MTGVPVFETEHLPYFSRSVSFGFSECCYRVGTGFSFAVAAYIDYPEGQLFCCAFASNTTMAGAQTVIRSLFCRSAWAQTGCIHIGDGVLECILVRALIRPE